MTVMTSTSAYRPHLWMAGDLSAFFGFGTNILVNMLVLTGLLRFVVKMPDAIVFGRILPALGLMLCLSTFYYAYLAYRLARTTGRDDRAVRAATQVLGGVRERAVQPTRQVLGDGRLRAI